MLVYLLTTHEFDVPTEHRSARRERKALHSLRGPRKRIFNQRREGSPLTRLCRWLRALILHSSSGSGLTTHHTVSGSGSSALGHGSWSGVCPACLPVCTPLPTGGSPILWRLHFMPSTCWQPRAGFLAVLLWTLSCCSCSFAVTSFIETPM